ncbi:hypothetical protein [Pseudomonas atagonensis]|uniref:hypothetical protein n=1 Tax=Pseudomonas atagonensis TaxID=2609964 RepID=UPI00140874F9|nr:hypothetical protein [Pseudomonas atagonensis]
MPDVTDEAAPTNKIIRVGIELEGFGRVNTKWEKPGEEAVIAQDGFYNVFKRTPLIRSDSFNAATGHGVYLTPEDASDGYGKSSPVELVSNPHPFTTVDLTKLQISVKNAAKPTSPMRKSQKTKLSDPRKPAIDLISGKEATSRWEYHRATISRNLQTTIGVSVEKLLSIKPELRKLAVQTLILNPTRQSWVLSLIVATVTMQKNLTDVAGPLAALKSKKEVLGLRLAIFMYLTRIFAEPCLGGKVWAKDSFGANFKGYSSFIGCGAANNNDILKATYALDPLKKTQITENLLLAVKAVSPEWLDEILTKTLDLDHIGQPGLSTQTAVQEWFAIPNFYNNENLYTVIESREGLSLLNQQMAKFLNEKISSTIFHLEIKTRLHK